MSQTAPPDNDELELSLFGPGLGECAVVHVGAGSWLVVDSCLNAKGDRPVALEYLESLHVDVEKDVELVIITHWHDDHIRGASALLQAASAARFVCSAALRSEEFTALLTACTRINFVHEKFSSGVRELERILSILHSRKGRASVVGPDEWASAGQVLLRHESPFPVRVHVLSPSATTITEAKVEFAKLLPDGGEPPRRLPSPGPNATSVVVLIEIGQHGLLLGSDLEVGGSDHKGWRGIVASATRPRIKGSTYKVAHHGSGGADCSAIWTELLIPRPCAMLTPYATGRKPLPSHSDIERMMRWAGALYSTVWPPTVAPRSRAKPVDRTMREIASERRTLRNQPGQVRLRVRLASAQAGAPRVELFHGGRLLHERLEA